MLVSALAPAAATVTLAVLWLIGSGKELWYSERFVQVVGARSWSEMFQLLRFENNPPLFFVVARLWESLVGQGERAARALPLLFGVIFLFILWMGTVRIAGRRAASYAVMVASVSGMIVSQATEYRMYTLLLCCSAAALLLTTIYTETRTTRALYALTVVSVVGLYTHYTFIPLWLFLSGWLFITARLERKRIVVHALATLLIFIPWLWYSFLPIALDLRSNLGIQQHSGAVWELLILPFRTVAPALFGETRSLFVIRMIASAVAAIAMVIGIKKWWRGDERNRKTILLLLGSSLFTVATLTVARLTAPKYASVAMPAAITLIGIGLSALDDRYRSGRLLAVVVIIVSAIVAAEMARAPYVTYAESARIIEQEERDSDRLLVYPFNDEIALRPYYNGSLRVDGFFPLKTPEGTTLKDNIQYNFRSTLDERTVDMLGSYVSGAPRVWFFYDVSMTDKFWNSERIDSWFVSHGYARTVFKETFHNVPPLLVRYDVMR